MANDRSINTYHKAFKAYCGQVDSDVSCRSFSQEIANVPQQRLDTTLHRCRINGDWIDRIEEGLSSVSKAIQQNRQFIHQNGEIVIIEKAKRVSKASVAHLAKNSKYITHEPIDDNIIPDKIYMAENQNNYAVYENRFLYLLLTELQTFLEEKYKKINEACSKFKAEVSIDKKIQTENSKIRFALQCKEISDSDEMIYPDKETKVLATRIQNLMRNTDDLLQTGLMVEMSTVDKLQPPVTRTNVLRMDPDFQGAMVLYDFISSYKEDGFILEEVSRTNIPFSLQMQKNFAQLVSICTYLMHRYGANLDDVLEQMIQEGEGAVIGEQHSSAVETSMSSHEERKPVPNTDIPVQNIDTINELRTRLENTQQELERTTQKLYFTAAQLRGVRAQYGLISSEEDYSSKERIEELEQECDAFLSFFGMEWKEAKKKMRRKYLWPKKETKENED